MKKEIIAYGAGAAFRNYIKNRKENILFVIDNNVESNIIENVPVHKFEYLKEFLSEKNKDVFIVIFAMSSEVVKSISNELINLGLEYGKDFNEYSFLLKDYMKNKFKEYDIELKENIYEFTKSLFETLNVDNQSSVIGSWIILSLIDSTKNLNGDIIELGVYKGGNAFYSCLYKSSIGDNRNYFLVDSFEGFHEYSCFDPKKLNSMFKNNSVDKLKRIITPFDNAKIVKGYIPDVLKIFNKTKASIIYYDCDTYKSCKDSLCKLFDKLQKKRIFYNT